MRLILAVAALALLAPPVLATWSSSFASPQEPSTAYDASGGWMWQNAPAAGAAQLYLDARYVPASTLSALPHFEAVLGVWVDCNGDGVIGGATGETYGAVLLLDPVPCPPGTRHNDGATVTELLHVGPGAAYPHIADPDARIWLDRTTPVEPAPATKTFADHVFSFHASAPRWVSVGSAGLEPQHATAYAFVGAATLAGYGAQVPSGGAAGAYGAEFCPPGHPGLGNWVCDPSQWLTSPQVLDPYYLRDVDCTSPC